MDRVCGIKLLHRHSGNWLLRQSSELLIRLRPEPCQHEDQRIQQLLLSVFTHRKERHLRIGLIASTLVKEPSCQLFNIVILAYSHSYWHIEQGDVHITHHWVILVVLVPNFWLLIELLARPALK